MSKEEILRKRIGIIPAVILQGKAGECVGEAMDEYAKQEAIGFDEWKLKEGYKWNETENKWVVWQSNGLGGTSVYKCTPEELYSLYQQSKSQK